MKPIFQTCVPRRAVLDGTADFVVNLSELPRVTDNEAREFLHSKVLASDTEPLLINAFSRRAGRCARWIYAASLSDVRPRGLTEAELAEYSDNATDFLNIRTTRLAPILTHLRETAAHLPNRLAYRNHLSALQLRVEHWKG